MDDRQAGTLMAMVCVVHAPFHKPRERDAFVGPKGTPAENREALSAAYERLSGAGELWRRRISEDALQVAVIELLERYARGDRDPSSGVEALSPEGAQTLLSLRARSRTVDEWRGADRAAPASENAHVAEAGPEERCSERLDAERWVASLERALPASHRSGWTTLRARVVLDLSAREVAHARGVSHASVRQRESRAARWIRTVHGRHAASLASRCAHSGG